MSAFTTHLQKAAYDRRNRRGRATYASLLPERLQRGIYRIVVKLGCRRPSHGVTRGRVQTIEARRRNFQSEAALQAAVSSS